jgi:hypothetical protein
VVRAVVLIAVPVWGSVCQCGVRVCVCRFGCYVLSGIDTCMSANLQCAQFERLTCKCRVQMQTPYSPSVGCMPAALTRASIGRLSGFFYEWSPAAALYCCGGVCVWVSSCLHLVHWLGTMVVLWRCCGAVAYKPNIGRGSWCVR